MFTWEEMPVTALHFIVNITQRVVVQIKHPKLWAVSHGDGEAGPTFGAYSGVGAKR